MLTILRLKRMGRDFPGGPVVKNLLSNAGDTDLIPGQGTKIPHAMGQLSPCVTTREKASCCGEDLACCNCDPTKPKQNKTTAKREWANRIWYSVQITFFFPLATNLFFEERHFGGLYP